MREFKTWLRWIVSLPRITALWLAIGASVLAVLLAGVVVTLNGKLQRQGAMLQEQLNKSFELRAQIQRTFSAVLDIETGQRGFLISADARFLDPYERATMTLDHDLEALNEMLLVRPEQWQRFEDLKRLITRHRVLIAASIDQVRREGLTAGRDEAAQGGTKEVMEAIRSIVTAMLADEDQAIAAQAAANRQHSQADQDLILAALGCMILLIAIGGLAGVVHVVRRKRMQAELDRQAQALRHAWERQEAVFMSATDGIITLNESASIETLNPAAERIFGFAADAILRRDIGRLMDFGTADDENSAGRLRQWLADGKSVRELMGRRQDGRMFPIDLAVAEMPIGTRRMFVLFVRDITERKRHERMKDEFVATVSHELRTPLTSIAGSLGLLAGRAAGALPDPAMRLLTIAHTNSQRLVRLINDILDIEKIESGKMAFDFRRVEVRALVEQAIDANRGFADSFGVKVRLDPDASEGFVQADADRLTQVVTNLLSNAVKFSPRGQEVTVGIASADGRVRVTVRDHGPGIPEDFKSRIFEKFAQVDGSDARQKGGTGLGLSIVKQIMIRLDGDVGFEPGPEGGTVFHIELAAAPDLPEVGPLPAADEALILLCEDDPDAATVMVESLQQAGFTTHVAYTAEQAVRGAASTDYAAILVDLQLPDSDGISLIKNLRAQPRYHNTPIVVVSADPRRGRNDRRASTLNVLDWLAKPVDIDRLVSVLNRPIVREVHNRPRILHLDDDRDVLQLVAQALASSAEMVSVDTIEAARAALAQGHFDLAVLDVALAEGFGLDLLPELSGADGQAIPVVVFSAQDTPEVAARVLAVLSKSRASIDSLIATLRKLVQGRPPAVPMKEVA